MVTDKNGEPLEHFDIVYIDNSGCHGFWRSYLALVFLDRHGKLMMCDFSGISQIPTDAKKVAHFPSTKYHLPKDVEYEYIRYLKTLRSSIDEEILNFVKTTNKAKAGVVDGRAQTVCQDDY